MLVDAAKGLEPQTRKLFEVCRLRNLPIFTFCNKLDRPALEPLDLLDQIEQEFNLPTYAVSWPIGSGPDFQGVVHRAKREVHLYERVDRGNKASVERIVSLDSPELETLLGADLHVQVLEEIELLDELHGTELDLEAIANGEVTPVFFGSAMSNFGVQIFLDCFLEYACPPGERKSIQGTADKVCLLSSLVFLSSFSLSIAIVRILKRNVAIA